MLVDLPTNTQRQSDFRLIVLLTVALLICLQHLPSKNEDLSSQVVWPVSWRAGNSTELKGLYFDELSHDLSTNSQQELPPHIAPIFFQPIAINRASVETLTIIPGIGKNLSQQIVNYRDNLGPIQNASDLMLIDGIGKKKAAIIIEYVNF